MGAIDSGLKFGKVVYDENGKIRQAVKTMDGSFDSNEMIEALVEAKRVPITRIEDENDVNSKLLEELTATKTDFDSVSEAIKNLSNPIGLKEGGVNLFGVLHASLSSGSGLSESKDLASFTISNHKLAHQTFSFEVLQKASYDTMISTSTLSSTDLLTTPIVTNGNVKLAFNGHDRMAGTQTILTANLGNPVITTNGNLILPNKTATANITLALTSTMTLETVQSTINQNTYQTGIKAILENDSNLGRRLVLISEGTGQIIDPTNSDVGILTDLGLESNSANLTKTVIDIPLDSTMDYATIVTTINGFSEKTNVQAELVSTGAGQFKFVLTGQNTGQVIDPTASTGSISVDLGLSAVPLTTLTTLQAKVNYKNVQVVSNINNFEIFSGIKANILKAETGNVFNVTIGPPVDLIEKEISDMVDNLNIALANLRERLDTENEESHMQDIAELKQLETRISYTFGAKLEKYGISRDTTGTNSDSGIAAYKLVFDHDLFKKEAAENFLGLQTAFAFQANKVGTDEIRFFNKPMNMPTALAGKTFNVKVTATDANGLATAAEFEILNGATVTATIDNGTIKGPEGSDFEGFEFIYYGGSIGATKSVQFSPTYGVMNSLVNIFDNIFDSDKSFVTTKKTSLEKKTETNIETIDRKLLELDDFKMMLIMKYQASQSRVIALQTSLTFLKVQLGLQLAQN